MQRHKKQDLNGPNMKTWHGYMKILKRSMNVADDRTWNDHINTHEGDEGKGNTRATQLGRINIKTGQEEAN